MGQYTYKGGVVLSKRSPSQSVGERY